MLAPTKAKTGSSSHNKKKQWSGNRAQNPLDSTLILSLVAGVAGQKLILTEMSFHKVNENQLPPWLTWNAIHCLLLLIDL